MTSPYVKICLLLSLCVSSHYAIAFDAITADTQIPLDPKRTTPWPDEVVESSGLAQHQGLIWTINDSGDGAYVYGLNEAGNLVKKVAIKHANNVDYESLAQDQQYLYVGDIGNNYGRREELVIYRLAWSDLTRIEQFGSVKAEKIKVQLNDRSKYRHRKAHNYDFEALTVKDDELWLFSKNRLDGNTELYRFPKTPGLHRVNIAASFDTKSLITAVDIHPETNMAALLSYQIRRFSFVSYLWLVPIKDSSLDWGLAKSHQIHPGGQWESVMWSEDGREILLGRESSHQNDVAIVRFNAIRP